CFWKSGEVIWRVVVNKQDLIGGAGQYLGHAIQTEGSTFVQIISVAVISTIENNRDHCCTRMVEKAASPRQDLTVEDGDQRQTSNSNAPLEAEMWRVGY